MARFMPMSRSWRMCGIRYSMANLVSMTLRELRILSGWATSQRDSSLGKIIFGLPAVSSRANGFPFWLCYKTTLNTPPN